MPKSPINKCMGNSNTSVTNAALASITSMMADAVTSVPDPKLIDTAASAATILISAASDKELCTTYSDSVLKGFVSTYGNMLGSMIDTGFGGQKMAEISKDAVSAYTLSTLGMLDVRGTLSHFNDMASSITSKVDGDFSDLSPYSGVAGNITALASNAISLNVSNLFANLGKNVLSDVLSLSGNLNINNGLTTESLSFIGSIPNPTTALGSFAQEKMLLEFGDLGNDTIFSKLHDMLKDGTAGISAMFDIDGSSVSFPFTGEISMQDGDISLTGDINNLSQLTTNSIETQVKFAKAVIASTASSATEMISSIVSALRQINTNLIPYIVKLTDLTVDSLGVRTNNFIDILKKSMCGRPGKAFLVPISILYALSIRGPYNPILYKQLAYLTYKMIEETGMSEIDVANLTDSDMVIQNTIRSGVSGRTFAQRTEQVVRNWYESILKKFWSEAERPEWDICGLNREGDACKTVGIFLDLQKINTSLSEQSDGAALRADAVNQKSRSWARKLIDFVTRGRSDGAYAEDIGYVNSADTSTVTIKNAKASIYTLETDFENLFDPDADVSWDQTEDYCCLENETWDQIETILKDDKINFATKAILAHIIEYAELRVLPKEPTTIWDNQVALPVPSIPFPPPPTVFFPKNRIDFNKLSGTNEFRNLIASWASMAEKSMQVGIAETIRDATLLAGMVERYSPDVARQLRHKLKTLHPDVSKALESVETLQDISEYVGAWLFGLEADKSNVLFDEWKSLPISIRTCLRPMVNKASIEAAQTGFQRTNSLMYNVMAKTVGHGYVSPILPNSVIVEIEDELIDQTKVQDRSSEKYTIIYVKRQLGGDVDSPSSYQIIGNKLGVSHANLVNQAIKKFKMARDSVRYFIIGSKNRRTINVIVDVTSDYLKGDGLSTKENSYRISDGTKGILSFNSDTLKELQKKYKWNLDNSTPKDETPQIQTSYRENETCDVNVHDIVQNLPPYLDLSKIYEEPSDMWSPFNYGYRCYYGSDGEYHMHIMRYSKGDDLRGEIEEEVGECYWQEVDVNRQEYLYTTYILPGLQGEYIGSDVVNSYIDGRVLYSVELEEDRASMLYFPHDLYLYGDVEYRWFHMKYTIGGWGAMKGICEVMGKRIININYLYRVLNKVRPDYSSKWVVCDDSVVEFTKTGHQSPKKFNKIDTEGID